jgi:hypothetical protein
VVEEDVPCLKVSEIGLMWEIEAQSEPKRHGFARGGMFKPLVPDAAIDIDGFAQMCLNAARFSGTSAHHLVPLPISRPVSRMSPPSQVTSLVLSCLLPLTGMILLRTALQGLTRGDVSIH